MNFDWTILHWIQNTLVCPAMDFLMPKSRCSEMAAQSGFLRRVFFWRRRNTGQDAYMRSVRFAYMYGTGACSEVDADNSEIQ